MLGLGIIELLLISIPLIGGVLLIAGLCYVWMNSTRASQARVDEYNEEIIRLMREQTELLRRIAERG
jgi:hypothetical protein